LGGAGKLRPPDFAAEPAIRCQGDHYKALSAGPSVPRGCAWRPGAARLEKPLLQSRVFFRYKRDMALVDLRTKRCPFCAEVIQAEAIKCRFCGEFLNTAKARAAEAARPDSEQQEGENDKHILFAGKPSLWAIAPDAVKGAVFLVIAGLLIKLPLERMLNLGLTGEQAAVFGRYRMLAGLGIISVTLSILAVKALRLKMTYYEVTPDRIEWSRGILDRRVDNVDMFRVIDLKLRRSLLDCVLGIGTVALVTTDKSDPEFVFEKVRDARLLYDAIKKASLDADRRTGVVHLE